MPVIDLPVFPRGWRRRDEREFLPAGLGIVETPASPVGRATALTICAAMGVALAWSCLSDLDVVAVAAGRIVPTERTKTIQPLEIGVVRAIRAHDGQEVTVGDPLIVLDSTTTAAELERLRGELSASRLDAARLEAEAVGDETAFIAPEGIDETTEGIARRLLASTLAEHRAKLAGLARQEEQRVGERATVAATIDRLTAILPLLKERVEIRRYLAERETGSRMSWLELRQDLVDRERELDVQRSRLVEAEAAAAAAGDERWRARAEFDRSVLNDLTVARQKVAALTQELIKAEERTASRTLTAPVSGTVQQLRVTTLGGVVTPAEALMTIVPADSRIEVEAALLNKDVGFVAAGQPVEVKVDTFNFTKYGLVQGTVVNVSRDALKTEGATAGAVVAGTSGTAANDGGQGPVYAARIALSETRLMVDGKSVDLQPGMAVTAEIKTGRRRVIEYLLDPLMRYRHNSMRER